MRMVAIVTALIGILLVLAEAVFAYRSGMFFPSQVLAKWGQRGGIAFFIHGGMWGDLILLPPFFAILIDKLGDQWDKQTLMKSAMIGFAITMGNHVMLCLTQPHPDPIGWKKEWWSVTIALHFIYMWGASTILAQVLLYSPSASASVIMWTAIIIGIHMVFGMNIVLSGISRFARWEWCPESLALQPIIIQIGIWTALTGFTWRAAGGAEAMSVGILGAEVVAIIVLVATMTLPMHTAD